MRALLSPCVLASCLALAGLAVASDELAREGALTPMQVRQADTNKDGVISQEEYQRQKLDMSAWRETDANSDGVLDREEQERSIRPAPVIRLR